MSSFHVDARIDVKLEYELAVRLGEFIVNSGTVDKQILALGYKLFNMDEENVATMPNKRYVTPSQESSIESEWQENDPAEIGRFSNDENKVATMREKVYSVKRRSSSDKIRWGHQ